jgi:hypothetical protein
VSLVLLFTLALGVQSGVDAVAAAFALTVLIGLHTFLGFLREAFPINHFLEVTVLAVAALNLTLSRGGWWADVLAALTFVAASLTLESGVLVWVIIVAAWLCGLRGVSTRGVLLVTALLAGYFLLRFVYLETGMPSLTERSSGFLLERLEPSELQKRFASAPLVFYAYNVGASLLSVLVSEPREGVFVAIRAWLQKDVHPRVYLQVLSSLGMTAMIVWAAYRWWRRGTPLDRPERIAVVAAAVLAANCVISYSYLKDDIIAFGGVFYALAAYAAVRTAVAAARSAGAVTLVAASLAMLTLASAWAVRSSGVHHVIDGHTFRVRNDWAEMPMNWRRQGRWPTAPQPLALIEQLRGDALNARVSNTYLAPEWKDRWYGD